MKTFYTVDGWDNTASTTWESCTPCASVVRFLVLMRLHFTSRLCLCSADETYTDGVCQEWFGT